MNIYADLRSCLLVNIVDDFVHVLTTLSHLYAPGLCMLSILRGRVAKS